MSCACTGQVGPNSSLRTASRSRPADGAGPKSRRGAREPAAQESVRDKQQEDQRMKRQQVRERGETGRQAGRDVLRTEVPEEEDKSKRTRPLSAETKQTSLK